jgi:putative transposase
MPTPQPRALDDVERKEILRVLHEPDHVDEAPATVYAKLLDEGMYLASTSTMYRILHGEGEVSERRRQATHPARVKPELVAGGPNEVWSWDITKLLGPVKWTYYYLYVIIDIYSRYTPGWMLAHVERAHLAERLLADTIRAQGVERDQLTIHADRGPRWRRNRSLCSFRILGSPSPIPAPTSVTTTRTQNPSSRR